MAGSSELQCFSCLKKISVPIPVGRREECPHCRADVRVCKNCQFYDPKAYNECRETSAEVVREKDRSTLCDFFSPGSAQKSAQVKNDIFAAAEALFKNKGNAND